MRRARLVAVGVLGLGAGIGTMAMAEGPAGDLGQYQCFTSQPFVGDPLSGDCPTEGACDDPIVRSLYMTDEATPIRWLRAHLVVFRSDAGTDPALSEAEVVAQMTAMNADFLPWRVQFTYTYEFVNDSRYRYGGGNDDMKNQYARDPGSQCNIFITDLGGGVGTFPWWFDALTATGGIIIGGEAARNLPHLFAHEMGHNVGLWHTHHGVNEVPQCGSCYETPDHPNRDEVGDFCADTPPRPVDPFVCVPPGTSDPCSGEPWGDTQPENFMSYGYSCWDRFTADQAGRMHCWSEDILLSWSDCTAGDDCNENGTSDRCDIRDGTSVDVNGNWIPDECESCLPDIDGNGDVGFDDLLRVLDAWGPCEKCPEDLDGSGTVDFNDLLQVLAAWGACVQPVGACCLPDMSCTRGTESDCTASGGFYQGDDTGCYEACVPADHCQSAPVVGDGTYPYSTLEATTDGGSLPPECDEGGGRTFRKDVWAKYIAPCDGVATASVCDSDFDTRLAVYGGAVCYDALVACSDNACGDEGTRSSVEFPVEAGGQYLIRIGGRLSIGEGELVIECAGGG